MWLNGVDYESEPLLGLFKKETSSEGKWGEGW